MAETIPARLNWAVEKLALTGAESVLEIGCGRGVAVSLVCPLLGEGRIVAIDRSATAIEAAVKRNQSWIEAGKAIFQKADIETFDHGTQAHDVIFAINVNVFWLKAGPALASVRELLARDGRLVLVYEAPSAGQTARIRGALAETLAVGGFAVSETDEVAKANLLSVTAKPAK